MFFSFFNLKLFTLDVPAVKLTCEFYLYCWNHVCKVNEWCLVDRFHKKFGFFHLQQDFNGSLVQFFCDSKYLC